MAVARHAVWRAVRPVTLIPAFLILLFGFAEEIRAGEKYDGNWTISIFGAPGACQFGYRMRMTIDNGNVLYRGRQVSPHAIYVSNAGAVTLRLGTGKIHGHRLGGDRRASRAGAMDGRGLPLYRLVARREAMTIVAAARPATAPHSSPLPDFSAIPWQMPVAHPPEATPDPWLTPEGIAVKAAFAADDIAGIDFVHGWPGLPPFVRGPYPTMYVEQPWTIRQYAGFSTAEELERLLQAEPCRRPARPFGRLRPADPPRHDLDDPRVAGDVGMAGVASIRFSTCARCSTASRSTRSACR